MERDEDANRVRALLVGQGARHGEHRALLADHVGLAGWILRRAGVLEPFPCPHDVARGLRLDVVPSPTCPLPVLVNPPTILYRSSRQPRRDGLRVLLGVVGAELGRAANYAPADAWCVAAEIAVPQWARQLESEELVRRQRWVSAWFLRLLRSCYRPASARPSAP